MLLDRPPYTFDSDLEIFSIVELYLLCLALRHLFINSEYRYVILVMFVWFSVQHYVFIVMQIKFVIVGKILKLIVHGSWVYENETKKRILALSYNIAQ